MNTLGRHIVVEFYDCPAEIMSDVSLIENAMLTAARDADATVINSTFHHFSPFGVSGVVVIQESHLAIHTWPEYGYAAVDVFTCGETVNPWICYKSLKEAFQAGYGSAVEMGRGQMDILEKLEDYVQMPARHPESKPVAYHKRNIWYTERGENIALSLRHTGEILYKEQSPYQKVEVIDTFAYGKMLTLDGMVMTTEKDEYVYHEMITHVAMQTHPAPQRVLIIGGGDGGAVREIVRYESLEKVVMVEIDQLVIDACKAHLPQIAAAFDHPKLELHVDDGIEYVKNAPDESFDIVIVDSTDPVGPAEGLFTDEFYRQVYRILNNDGIMIVQSESPRYNTEVFQEIYECFRGIFGSDQVHCYLISVPTYPTGNWSLAFCAKGNIHPLRNIDLNKIKSFSEKEGLKYYNEDIHVAAFALPNYVRNLLNEKVSR
jgi:spermidine synthase